MRGPLIAVVAAAASCLILGACSSPKAVVDTAQEVREEQTQTVESEPAEYKLPFGELLDETVTETDHGTVLVVKAKIESSYSNKTTIDQNYYNAESLVKEHGADQYDELQYWAVADMRDGSEGKAISFTVDKQTMDAVVAGAIPANQMGSYVTDLWILSSLNSR